MEKLKYYHREQECSDIFNRLGQVYNAATPENHPTIFNTVEDYMAGMSIMGICAKMYSKLQIYAFQLMSNHVHLVVSGDADYIKEFFKYFTERLDKYFDGKVDLSGFELTLKPVNELSYFRNAIVYANRNGFVVCDNFTPFSYPWGTSQYFFQPMEITEYARMCGKPMGITMIRNLMHTKNVDGFKDIKVVNGYVSPIEFCDIKTAESVFFSDNDLYIAAVKVATSSYGTNDLSTLPSNQKIDLAKRLHYEYNAGSKQLQRMLKIAPEVLDAILG